ncbi:putative enzyme related to lactoylglutathione lyase [Psychromicrobium silvestre]|uniref:Putative enzyme related to lactoylglutathione lyase n=1 Tax=Psychromicrobium silvestre TaxID=1645614 RepID=A0A7Y9LQV3_9MICC|nr:VOC family protein [Psychromicrobium silvestre]NYE93911.1 putative enzyme related to lactoylglutathione lyase [Psychromicrobium silvestre]
MTSTRVAMVNIDCADPAAMATFWSAVLGWEIRYSAEEYSGLQGPDYVLAFGKIPDYQPPAWPNERGSKQFHLDLAVEDIAAEEQRCLSLGATVASDQEEGQSWRVLIDPGGHPFCLTKPQN